MTPRSESEPTSAARRSSMADRVEPCRILHRQVALDELVALGVERGELLVVEVRGRRGRAATGTRGGRRRAMPGRRRGCARPAGGRRRDSRARCTSEPRVSVDRRALGQLLDAGEAERQRARRELLDPAGRQAGRHLEHVTHPTTGVSHRSGPSECWRSSECQRSGGSDLRHSDGCYRRSRGRRR